MIIILRPDTDKTEAAYAKLMKYLQDLPNIAIRLHDEKGDEQTLTEIYLVGNTMPLASDEIEAYEVVDRVVRVSREYRSEGNRNVIFCLRGMKTNYGDPHRNLVDFSHVPAVKTMTRMPVCIDPSHSVGSRNMSPDNIMDIFHSTAQGVIAGANMILVDCHPRPEKALVDGPQALKMDELPWFLQDIQIAREAYLKRCELQKQLTKVSYESEALGLLW
jgi:hypothetical protein